MTPNEQLIAHLNAITDPVEALQALLDNWEFLSGDPYYSEFSSALYEMVERALKGGTDG